MIEYILIKNFVTVTLKNIIKIFWINPKENISREKEVLVPAGHGSVYDFRYIEARLKGLWSFKVIDNEKEFSTTFEIK